MAVGHRGRRWPRRRLCRCRQASGGNGFWLVIVIDSSVIYALLDDKDRNHQKAADWYLDSLPALATTPLILAEVDHLAGARAGRVAQQAWRPDLEAGAYDVTWWADATDDSARIAEQYGDLRVGLADASLAALAARLGIVEIAAFDERHFRVMRPKRVATRSGCYPQTPDSLAGLPRTPQFRSNCQRDAKHHASSLPHRAGCCGLPFTP
jgi:predicted nucleic acid-binding protein